MFAGQLMVGGVLVVPKFTVTVKLHLELLPAASVAVQATVVVPGVKLEPEGGVQLVFTPGQLSVTTGGG
jgi:hypothetical protein